KTPSNLLFSHFRKHFHPQTLSTQTLIINPSYSQGLYKTRARKNSTPKVELSDDERSDNETFINVDASPRFSKFISGMGMLSEHGFIFDNSEEDIGTINMIFSLSNIEDRYQELLDSFDDGYFYVFMESLCNMGTKWLESGGENTVKRMDL
ncbi:hypothetical protein RYX36_007518, partial [Vicia faba]